MPDETWNKLKWNDPSNWGQDGDVWSVHWGSVRAQWLTTVLPRIAVALPARSIVEIAPGHGRWTEFLLQHSEQYRGFDLAELCIRHCNMRFARQVEAGRAQFAINDGQSLPGVSSSSIDFVFSFDSLVHVEQTIVDAYLAEIARVLVPGGMAFLHHSNLGALRAVAGGYYHERDPSQSAARVRRSLATHGLEMRVQETVTWGDISLLDCFTLMSRPLEIARDSGHMIENVEFWDEANLLAKRIAPYIAG